jgi:hypothetical protein
MSTSTGPGTLGYWLALLFLLGGIGMAVVQFLGLSRRVESMNRVVMPGTAEVKLPQGETSFYIELRSRVDNQSVTYQPGNFECAPSDASAVKLSRPSGEVTYSFGEYSGERGFIATADRPAEISITCTGIDMVLAWGQDVTMGILAAVGSAVLGVGIAFFLFLITWLRRRSFRRGQLAAAHAAYAAHAAHWPGAPPGPPGAPPGPYWPPPGGPPR